MTENYIKLDLKSYQDMCEKIITLTAQNKKLTEENELLKTQKTILISQRNKYKHECFILNQKGEQLMKENLILDEIINAGEC